ncbi:MAG: type IV pilus biogenesis protein PilM [Phycisphaerae bacterium]
MAGRGRNRELLALDWDTRTLRVVYARVGNKGVTIDRLLSVKIPPEVDVLDAQQMGRHIRRVLDEEGIQATYALVDIPRDQTILKTLRLPVISPDELPGMVSIQIAKELPFPVAEAAIDFACEPVGDSDDAATADVLVAAVQSEVIAHYTATFEAAGLKLERVGLRPYAGKVAVCMLLRHALPQRVLFLDVSPTLTEINVLRGGALAFSRAASVMIPELKDANQPSLTISYEGDSAGEEDGAEDAEGAGSGVGSGLGLGGALSVDAAVRSLSMEVTRSIEAYRALDADGTIDHVVIGGDLGLEEALAESLQASLNVTTELYNPASTFGWEPDDGAGASAFSASLGLVLGHADEGLLHFNFLQPKKTVTQAQRRLKKAPMIAAVVALFAIATVAFAIKITDGDRARRATLVKEIESLQSRVKENKRFLKFMKRIYAFEDQLVWVDVIDDTIKTLPSHEELYLERIDADQKNGIVKLRTLGKQSDTALNAIDALQAFRREGKTLPRFEAHMGSQKEDEQALYPYAQEIRITVLNDGKPHRKRKGKRN